jgi:predicted metal-dependent phosphoesterase TrpH
MSTDPTTEPRIRCDLHVHSRFSGAVNLPLLRHVGYECYSEPREVYEAARRRGMELVTLTDHDSIEGAVSLLSLPGTFVSEEVTCRLPGGRELHLGVYDVDEAQHERISGLRADAEALFAYLAEQRIATAANHLFSALTGPRVLEDFDRALGGVSHVECRNGMMPAATNRYAGHAASDAALGQVGGSDAHTLASVARAYTEVPGARTREDFLEGLRHGRCVAGGESGSYLRLTADVLRVFAGGCAWNGRHMLDGPREAIVATLMLGLIPALPLLPLVTAALHAREHLFAQTFFRRFQRSPRPVRRPRPTPRPAALGGRLALGAGR